ncbi:NAD(P)-dependent oxidoreductase [Spirillospora sp. NPDC047279]|uniref:NAD-dependent epimerase/dehydratase family protein n=1 Tax=Spirillospora sp. NPDC047279 TaxID=3155478 RepID=UPI003403F11A
MGGLNRVAVVGATGCVGRQVCAALTRRDHDVLAIARRPAPHLADRAFAAVDVAAVDARTLAKTFEAERVEAVVNTSGGWGTTEEEMDYAHVRLVERLVEALALMDRPARLVHMGTIHEYGPAEWGTLIGESIEPRPVTPYARTKFAGSEAVLRAMSAGRIEGIVLRAANICGPHPAGGSFPGFLLRRLREIAAEGGALELSIAAAKRDFFDVRDAAEAAALAVRATTAEPVVNIGSGEAVDMREFVTLFVAAAGFPADVLKVDGGQVESKGGDWTRTDIRLAGAALGWTPATGLGESLRDMWEASDE